VRPRRTILTHMGPKLDYETLRRTLPPGMEPGYDGMTVEF
jgi:phosphoribosyl 1,2-cyclic phosphate phosphodiesterase